MDSWIKSSISVVKNYIWLFFFVIGNGLSSSLETTLDFDDILRYVGDWNTYQYGMLVGILNPRK